MGLTFVVGCSFKLWDLTESRGVSEVRKKKMTRLGCRTKHTSDEGLHQSKGRANVRVLRLLIGLV